MRQCAARNLGALSKMSLRVDQLAGDLLTSAHMAEGGIREAQLSAVRGVLLASGDRLSAPLITKLGASLETMLSNAGVLMRIRPMCVASN